MVELTNDDIEIVEDDYFEMAFRIIEKIEKMEKYKKLKEEGIELNPGLSQEDFSLKWENRGYISYDWCFETIYENIIKFTERDHDIDLSDYIDLDELYKDMEKIFDEEFPKRMWCMEAEEFGDGDKIKITWESDDRTEIVEWVEKYGL